MEEYYELEKCVLSSLLTEPKLMEGFEIDDKYFKKYKRLWIYMKEYFNEFHNFDLTIMKSVCQNESMMVHYVVSVLDSDSSYVNFESYVSRLKKMYEEKVDEKVKIETIYKLATKLFVGNINLEDFNEKLNSILN